jgi:hypothetical protein
MAESGERLPTFVAYEAWQLSPKADDRPLSRFAACHRHFLP